MRFWKKIFLAILGLAILLPSNCFAYVTPSTNDMRVGLGEERTYYIRSEYDSYNAYKRASGYSTLLDMIEYKLYVEDTFPEGLEFKGFETSEDGTFGGHTRSTTNSVPCGGVVIDDTKEEAVDEGTWTEDGSEYYYHGLHYRPDTRKITYTIEGLQAGCRLDIGVKFKSPESVDDPETEVVETRRDFYNNPVFRSSTGGTHTGGKIHINIEDEYGAVPRFYWLRYAYAQIPEGVIAQDLPAPEATVQGGLLKVADDQYYPGYRFEWRSRNSEQSPINEDGYIQVNNTTTYVDGYIIPLEDGETDDTPLYTVHYEVDNAPAWYRAPSDRKYLAGQNVSVDRNTNRVRSSIYEFSGWDSDDVDVGADGIFGMPSRNVTLRGDFDGKTYTITYAFEGDLPQNADELLPEPQIYSPGDEVVAPENPIADGYVFSGWYLDDGFRMPNEDLTVTGRWRQVEGTFEPKLSIKISDDDDHYKDEETANFEIIVENTTDSALNSVLIKELLDGAVFIESDNYEATDNLALIRKIPANSSVTLYAKYDLKGSDPEALTNTVELISASGKSGYSLANKDYKASVDFFIDREIINAGTGDNILLFFGFITVCGIVIIVVSRLTSTRRRWSFDTKKMFIAAGVTLFGGFVFVGVCNAMNTYSTSDSIAGIYKVTSSARWIDYATAQIDINLKSEVQEPQRPRDVIYLVSNSLGMTDIMDTTKEKLNDNIDDLLSDGQSRAALISFNNEVDVLSDFTSDASAIESAVDNMELSGHTDYAAALNKVRDFLANYEHSSSRDLIVVMVSNTLADFGDDAGSLAYYFLKRDYPYVDIAAVQYQMHPGRVLAGYSDRQYFATTEERVESFYLDDQDEYGYAIKRAQTPALGFDSLRIDTGIDTDNFEVRSILSSFGMMELNGSHVIWDAEGAEAGGSIKAQIVVQLKDEAIAAKLDNYHLQSSIQGSYEVNGNTGNVALGEDISLSGYNTVDYEIYPTYGVSVLSGTIPEQTKYLAYSAVPLSDAILNLNNYNFIGWVPAGEDLVYAGQEFFIMDDNPVTVRPTFGKTVVSSVKDGGTYTMKSAYMDTSETSLNHKLNTLVGNAQNPSNIVVRYWDDTIKHFVRSETLPEDFVAQTGNTVTGSGSAHPVYIWVDGDTAYYYTAGRGKVTISSLLKTFTGFRALEDISGVADWDTKKITSINETFSYDSKLVDASPIAGWNTSRVTSISNIFMSASVTTLEPLRNWDLGSITRLDSAFQGTNKLTDISVLENLNTSKVTSMQYMFSGSGFSDTSVMHDWDVSKVTNMRSMFSSNKKLRDLGGLENWNVSAVTNMSGMFFDGCQMNSLEPLRNWVVSAVTDMSNMFYCNTNNTPQNLTTLEPIFGWNVGSSVNKASMFNNISLPLPSWY